MSIFKVIGHFFEGLFNAAKKAYNKLSPEQQTAIQQGTGLVAIINDNLNAAPEKVIELMAKKFPLLDSEKLLAALFAVANSFNLTKLETLESVVGAIQKHLNSLKGKTWAVASHAAASLLAVLFAPPETKVATIVSLIEWAYRVFVKKDVNE